LQFASECLQDDKEVVLTAVKNIGYAFEYASKRLQANKEVVSEACRKAPSTFKYASKELKCNKKFLNQLFNFSPSLIFNNCHYSIRKHPDVYLPVLESHPSACWRFSPNVLLKLDFSSLPLKNREVIFESFQKRTKEKDIFVLANAKNILLN
jgi:hypothetical protein